MNTLLLAAALVSTPPVPTVTGPITSPGVMYPNPPVSIVPTAVKVEDFPYVTEEYFVSGTANGAPYMTRIIIRRPKDAKAFSGTVVGEAMHAGGRSLIFEWSRVSILTRHHVSLLGQAIEPSPHVRRTRAQPGPGAVRACSVLRPASLRDRRSKPRPLVPMRALGW